MHTLLVHNIELSAVRCIVMQLISNVSRAPLLFVHRQRGVAYSAASVQDAAASLRTMQKLSEIRSADPPPISLFLFLFLCCTDTVIEFRSALEHEVDSLPSTENMGSMQRLAALFELTRAEVGGLQTRGTFACPSLTNIFSKVNFRLRIKGTTLLVSEAPHQTSKITQGQLFVKTEEIPGDVEESKKSTRFPCFMLHAKRYLDVMRFTSFFFLFNLRYVTHVYSMNNVDSAATGSATTMGGEARLRTGGGRV